MPYPLHSQSMNWKCSVRNFKLLEMLYSLKTSPTNNFWPFLVCSFVLIMEYTQFYKWIHLFSQMSNCSSAGSDFVMGIKFKGAEFKLYSLWLRRIKCSTMIDSTENCTKHRRKREKNIMRARTKREKKKKERLTMQEKRKKVWWKTPKVTGL